MLSKIKNPYFLALFLTIIYYLLAVILTWGLFRYIDLDFFNSDINVFFTELFPYLLIAILSIFITKNNNLNPEHSAFKLSFLLVVLFIAIATRVFIDPIFRIYEVTNKSPIPEDVASVELSWLNYLLIFVKTVILIPIVEELFFRGIILKNLIKNNKGVVLSIIFTSFLFMLVHINFMSVNFITLATVFIFSIFSGFVYIKYGLLYSILFHWAYNLIWMGISVFKDVYWNIIRKLNFDAYYWLLIVTSIIILILFIKKSLFNISKKNAS